MRLITPLFLSLVGTSMLVAQQVAINPDFSKGNTASVQGNLDEAVADFTKALQADPKLAVALVNRAMIESRIGKDQLALNDLDSALDLAPTCAAIYNVRGRLKRKLNDLEASVKDYTKALQIDPNNFDACMGRAEVRLTLAMMTMQNPDSTMTPAVRKLTIEEAISDFDQAIQVKPESPYVYAQRANAKRILAMDPNNPVAPDPDPGLEDLQKAKSIVPHDSITYLEHASVLQGPDMQPALDGYSKAIELDPTNAEAYVSRATFYLRTQQLPEASKELGHAIEFGPKRAQAKVDEGDAALAKNQLAVAVAAYAEAFEYIDLLAFAYTQRYAVDTKLNNTDEASNDLDGENRYAPTNPGGQRDAATMKAKKGDLAGALLAMDKVIQQTPDANSYFDRGLVKRRLGDLDGALADLSQALVILGTDSSQGSYAVRRERSFIYAQKGHLKEALEELEAINPSMQDSSFAYVELYKWQYTTQQGNKAVATQNLQGNIPYFKDNDNWTPQIARYLLGSLSESDLLKFASNPSIKEQKGTMAEADYWIATKHLIDSDFAGAKDHFQKCVDAKQLESEEYYASQFQVQRLSSGSNVAVNPVAAPIPHDAPVLIQDCPGNTEDDWLADSVLTQICDQVFLQANPGKPLPDDGFKIIADSKDAPTFHLSATTLNTPDYHGEAGDYPLTYIWDARGYSAFVKKLNPTAPTAFSQDPEAEKFLADLLDLRSETLANQDTRLSTLLSAEPLNPQVNEEAALLDLAMAWRENAGSFSEIRPLLCRATAHLALADALSQSTSWNNRIAETALKVFACRETDALSDIKKDLAMSDCPPSAKTWLQALQIKASGDWRVLTIDETSPLLLKIAWFQVLDSDINGTLAAHKLESFKKVEPISDWGRAISSDAERVSVENGHRLFDGNGQANLELSELDKALKIETGTGLAPETMANILATPLTGSVTNKEGKPQLQVLGIYSFASSARRHVLNILKANDYWMLNTLGDRTNYQAFFDNAQRSFGNLPDSETVFDPDIEHMPQKLRQEHKAFRLSEMPVMHLANLLSSDDDARAILDHFYGNGAPFGTAFQAHSRLTEFLHPTRA